MASYTISKYTATTVTINVQGLSVGQRVHVLVRLGSDPKDKTVDAWIDTTSTSIYRTWSGLTPKTEYYANVSVDGSWLGRQVFTTPESSRPNDWAFTSTIESGSPIALTAAEWNGFCARINEFATYCGQTEEAFTTVSSGTPISASIVNEARTAISKLSGHGTLPSVAVAGGTITASFFNKLASALNSIP